MSVSFNHNGGKHGYTSLVKDDDGNKALLNDMTTTLTTHANPGVGPTLMTATCQPVLKQKSQC